MEDSGVVKETRFMCCAIALSIDKVPGHLSRLFTLKTTIFSRFYLSQSFRVELKYVKYFFLLFSSCSITKYN